MNWLSNRWPFTLETKRGINMAEATQDFCTVTDRTDARREIREAIQLISRYPDELMNNDGKTEAIKKLTDEYIAMTPAPTRAGMSQELAQWESLRDQSQKALAQMQAVVNRLESKKEVEGYESQISENTEACPTANNGRAPRI
jgi:hypothetical protein